MLNIKQYYRHFKQKQLTEALFFIIQEQLENTVIKKQF